MDHQDFVHDSKNRFVTKSEVLEFYSGKTIFLTGVTGFLGKLIVEKLLRSCRDLKRIYLLVRSKKGKNINERYEELFAGPSMERLKREHPEFREKISLLNGDLLLPNLGMSEESIEILKEEIEIVIHCAATVKFNQEIKEATYINVRSFRDLIVIAKNMKKLKSFLYISTAYSHCPRKYIREKLYDPPLKPEDLIRLVDIFDREKLNQITPSILGKWPNTYSFTKATAEGLIKQEGTCLPITIVRPSIEIATDTIMEVVRDVATTRMIWWPNVTLDKNEYLYEFKGFQTKALAFIADIYFALRGKEQIGMKGLKKIRAQLKLMEYFSFNDWEFEISNTKDLFESLNPVDQEIFQFDMEKFVWKNYVLDYVKGIRLHLIKDPIENLSAGQELFSKLKIYHYICCTVLYLSMLYLIIRIVNLLV